MNTNPARMRREVAWIGLVALLSLCGAAAVEPNQ